MSIDKIVKEFIANNDCPEFRSIDKLKVYNRSQANLTLEITFCKQISSQQQYDPLPIPASAQSFMAHVAKGRKSAIRSEYGETINSENYVYLHEASGKVLLYSFSIKKTSVPIVLAFDRDKNTMYEERTLEFIKKGKDKGKTASAVRQLNNGIVDADLREGIVQNLINAGSIKKQTLRKFAKGKPTTLFVATEFCNEMKLDSD